MLPPSPREMAWSLGPAAGSNLAALPRLLQLEVVPVPCHHTRMTEYQCHNRDCEEFHRSRPPFFAWLAVSSAFFRLIAVLQYPYATN